MKKLKDFSLHNNFISKTSVKKKIFYIMLQPLNNDDKSLIKGPILTSSPIVEVSTKLLQHLRSDICEIF